MEGPRERNVSPRGPPAGHANQKGTPIEDPPAETTSALSEIKRDLVVSARALVASFRNPDLARAQLALVAFSICEWASFIALMVFAFDQGGAAAVGIISLVQLIPAAIIAPLGSVLGDRFPREKVFMLAEASMSVAKATIAGTFQASPRGQVRSGAYGDTNSGVGASRVW